MENIIQETLRDVGTARWIGTYENNSLEWHALRAHGIGGSEVGTILGLNPWESPFTLWAKKTNRIESNFEQNEAMEWGSRLESVIIKKFIDTHPELTVYENVGTYQHVEREWQHANPDAIYRREDGSLGILEVKTARYEDAWSEGVPPHYRAQVLWYLQTFGLQHATVIVLFSGSKYREFEVIADEFEMSLNLQTVTEFKRFIDDDVQPDFTAPMVSTYSTVRELHPDIDADKECELGTLGQLYENAAWEATRADEALNEMRSRVLDAMGTAKRGLVGGEWRFTRQARSGGTPYLITKKG